LLEKILKEYLGPYKKGVITAMVLLLIQSIASLYLPYLNADIINNGVLKGKLSYIFQIGAVMLGLSLLVMFASIGIAYLSAKISMGFGRDLRKAFFRQVQSFSAREMSQFGAPSLITRNTNDITQIQNVLFMALTMMIGAPITGIGAIILAVKTNVHLSALLLVSVPLMSLIIFLLLRRIVPLFRINQVKIDRLNLILREQVAGVRVIRAFVKNRAEAKKFEDASADLMKTTLMTTRTFAIMFPSLTIILNLSTVAVIWIGGHLIDEGKMPIGNLGAFISYILQVLMSVMMAVMMSLMIPRAQASAERVQQVLDTQSSLVETKNPVKNLARQGILEFHDVEFRYPGAQEPVLENISFTTRPGQFTAIVGSTGSGKSTLLNLMPRFIDPTKGKITLDGVDLRELDLEDLWAEIGYVPQRSFLFGGSIESNLRFGDLAATDEEMWHCLEIAQAKNFVAALPETLHASVAQGGQNFSGGQKQRLSIARALVKQAPIYLFDDSFSALDYATDAKLRAALHQNYANLNLVVVAQRVSTILEADQIVVLDAGKIVGIGKHRDLMESCQTYREIVESQLSPEEAS
jgi:ATP-binding cassette, subfamily B, multidrug efflux pump